MSGNYSFEIAHDAVVLKINGVHAIIIKMYIKIMMIKKSHIHPQQTSSLHREFVLRIRA